MKQFLPVDGIPILARTLLALSRGKVVQSLIVVVPPGEEARTRAMIRHFQIPLEAEVIGGGAERQESVSLGLQRVNPITDFVVIHDGVRPFVSQELLRACLRAAEAWGAAVAAIPVRETVKEVDAEGRIVRTPERRRFWVAQTPQVFRYDLIVEAHRRAREEGFVGTDDSSLVERLGVKVKVVLGSPENIKITTPEDLLLAEQLVKSRVWSRGSVIRVGIGFDAHPLVEGRRLILGGVEIPFERGLLGHSDADVLLHAVIDALLGAAGLGDIGAHFGPEDPRCKDASSLLLLEEAWQKIAARGFAISNIDATLIASAPRLSSFLEGMRKNIVQILGIEAERVNIKATTANGLGPLGAGEGIGAFAVALLVSKEGEA